MFGDSSHSSSSSKHALSAMLNPLQTCPQRDLLINNLPELPILSNQGSCLSKLPKVSRVQLPEIESGFVDRSWLLVKTENKVPGACIVWFGLNSPGQKKEEEEVGIWMPD